MAREIELKFTVNNQKEFLKKTQKYGIDMGKGKRQFDTIFFRQGKSFSDLDAGEPVIRIRRQEDVTTTTVKKYILGITAREEIECVIANADEFEKYLLMLDIIPVVNVYKIRRRGKYKGVTVTLDYVEELGFFSELEVITEESNEATLDQLYQIAEQLGLHKENIIKTPYDEMIYNKQKVKKD